MVNPGGTGRLEHRGHFGQIGALPAEEVLHLHRGPAVFVVEIEDILHRDRVSWCGFEVGSAAASVPASDTAQRCEPTRRPSGPGPRPPGAQARFALACISATSPSMATRACSVVSRSRTVTAPSSSESKSTVTHQGVPTSSCRR